MTEFEFDDFPSTNQSIKPPSEPLSDDPGCILIVVGLIIMLMMFFAAR